MNNIPQHFTASALVIHNQHVLLVHHRRIGAWLPPGGHIEPYEAPHEAAIREVFEETGLKVQVHAEQLPQTGDIDAHFLPLPLCFHRVRAWEKGQEVFHLDFCYGLSPCPEILEATVMPTLVYSKEVKEARWVKLTELANWTLAKNVAEVVELALSSKVKEKV